jgi:dipeptidyl aminopeptidase/acylaminoacyl peptidase
MWKTTPYKESATSGAPTVALEQDVNSPPALVITHDGGRTKLVALQPGLTERYSLGFAENVKWKDRSSRLWTGRLYYPVGYMVSRRYPLVIQFGAHQLLNPNQYSLSGNESAPSNASVAQPLANIGVFALLMSDPEERSDRRIAVAQEGPTLVDGCETAISYLDDRGLIDKHRVGLGGFSRTGFRVEYILTHSKLSFAAATVTDNADMSYGQYILAGHAIGQNEEEEMNGGIPVGQGLLNWLSIAPGFNADKVTAPLRMEIDTGGVDNLTIEWEMFAMLRRLHKPVEYFVLPDVEHGSHPPELPKQQLASMGGAVDWFDFWLNGREDPNPQKRDQYARWRAFRTSQNASVSQDQRDP